MVNDKDFVLQSAFYPLNNINNLSPEHHPTINRRAVRLASKILAEPVLVGRKAELDQLESCLKLVFQGKGATVLVSGEAGTGKTRLITEFLNKAKNQGATVLSGWCLSNTAVPYFPFFEAFNTFFTKEKATDPENVTTWLRGPIQVNNQGTLQVYTAQIWKDQTFAAVTKTLLSLSKRETIVFFIDDLHWADSASLALVHYIARAIRDERILLIATFRSEELKTDTEGRPHPLVETLRLMKRDDLVQEIKVAGLNQDGVFELAKSMLGCNLEHNLAERLSEESQGNPLFVVEALRMLSERNELIRDSNKWHLAGSKLGIPEKIKDIILQRLSSLLRQQRKMVEAASVIGEKFDANLLASLLDQDFSEVIERLDLINQATSLLKCEGDLYGFDHGRTRDAIYEELSPALKRVYHAKVAAQLVKTSKNDKLPFGELAYHFAQAGDEQNAVRYALAAGDDALERWSNAEAIKHFSYVLQVVKQDPKHIANREIVLEKLGDSYYANSMLKDAITLFEDIAKTSPQGSLKLRAYRKAMEAVFQYGDMTRLMDLAKAAEPFAAADRLENARILASKGRSLALLGNYLAAIGNWETALQVFEEEYSVWDAAWALIGTGGQHSIYALTDYERKKGLAESLCSIGMFQDIGDSRWQMEAYFVVGLALSLCFLDTEALEMFTKAVEIDEKMKMGDYLRLIYTYATAARSYWNLGDFGKGLAYSLKALNLTVKTDSAVAHAMVYSNLVIEYAILGDMNRSSEFFEKLMKFPPEILSHRFVEIDFPKPVFLAGSNQWKESNQEFEGSLERFKHVKPTFPPGALLRFKLLYAWALERQGRFDEVRIIREEKSRADSETEESFRQTDLRAHLMVRREVVVGEEFEMRLDLVNVGRGLGSLIRIEGLAPVEFSLTNLPSFCSLQSGVLAMEGKRIGPFQVESIKLRFKATKTGSYNLNPEVIYIDDQGETRAFKISLLTITAQKPPPLHETLPGRISTGSIELDRVLLGGIPEKFAIALAAPSSDERALFIENFLKAGINAGETTFYLTADPKSGKDLAEKYPSTFHLILCNPRADNMVQAMPNVSKLKGVENLTDIDIALTKALRSLDHSGAAPKRICVEIVSDVLLQHRAVIARKWLNELLPELRVQGFTVLAVVNPQMHSQEDVQAILGLFEGEIAVFERETGKGVEHVLRIRRMFNQKYLANEILLSRG